MPLSGRWWYLHKTVKSFPIFSRFLFSILLPIWCEWTVMKAFNSLLCFLHFVLAFSTLIARFLGLRLSASNHSIMGFQFMNHGCDCRFVSHRNWLLLRFLNRQSKTVRSLHVFQSYDHLYIDLFFICSSHCYLSCLLVVSFNLQTETVPLSLL